MATMQNPHMISSKERFSLLLLDPREIYFDDFGVIYYPNWNDDQCATNSQNGRLKICSSSLLFEPVDNAQPLLRFPLRECVDVSQLPSSYQRYVGDMITLVCNFVIEMKAGNIIAPYHFKKFLRRNFVFSLKYGKADGVLPYISQLMRASTLPHADQQLMISAIVHSRQSRICFDTRILDDLYENIVMETTAQKIAPLVTNPGRVMLTSTTLYFQPFNNIETELVVKIKLSPIKRLIKRRYMLKHVGLEFYCSENSPQSDLYLVLPDSNHRNSLYDNITSQDVVELQAQTSDDILLKWQNGLISNFEYLVFLNNNADRSVNDLTQYPVFPWIISDYTSDVLDLSDPKSFRDLSKPIGALNPDRLRSLKLRYDDMPVDKFLYGSHYSTPGFILYYLVRALPEYMLCLQNGQFDQADRAFYSIAETWRNVLTATSDFKELIPEFYQGDGDFLCNKMFLDLGKRQDGSKLHDVVLPPWARDAQDFVRICREALESDYVSGNLHHWIDLIFGYKQKGPEAVSADNVFYYMTYEGAIDVDSYEDLNERVSMETHVLEFGQTPKQLFKRPHPCKYSLSEDIPVSASDTVELDIDVADSSDSATCTEERGAIWSDTSNLQCVREHKIHRSGVTCICLDDINGRIVSTSQDGQLRIHDLETGDQVQSILLSMALSCCILIPGRKTVLVSCWDNNIYEYSIEFGRIVQSMYGHGDAVSDLWFCEKLLISSSWDGLVMVWEVKPSSSNRFPYEYNIITDLDHSVAVSCIDVNYQKKKLVSGCDDGHIYIWDIEYYTTTGQYRVHTSIVNDICMSKDSQKLVSAAGDGSVVLLDVATGTVIYTVNVSSQARCLLWNGQTLLMGKDDGCVMSLDLMNVSTICNRKGNTDGKAISCAVVNQQQDILLTACQDGKLLIWKILID